MSEDANPLERFKECAALLLETSACFYKEGGAELDDMPNIAFAMGAAIGALEKAIELLEERDTEPKDS